MRNWQLIAAALAIGLAGCSEVIPGLNVKVDAAGTNQYRVVPIDAALLARQAAEAEKHTDSDNLKALLPTEIPPDYKIGAGDICYVTVWDHPELSTPSGPVTELSITGPTQAQFVQGRLVTANGTIFFPYVGEFRAVGMTTTEMRRYIAQKLQNIITDPQVDVRVIGFRANRVEVTGEVAKPGTYTLDDVPKGILQGIDLAGGLTPTASHLHATLVRDGVSNQVDLAGLLSGRKLVTNPLLLPGDEIHIPDQSGDQVYVMGAVDKQQPLVIQESSMTLIQALTDAGGLDKLSAKQSGVLVFRMRRTPAEPKATVYALDLSHADSMLLASAFTLKPSDIVYVQATAFAQYNSVINEILPTVTTVFEIFEVHAITR